MNKIVFKAVTDAAQRREELSKESEKVDLSLVSDIDSLINEITSIAQSGSDVRTMVARAFNESKKALNESKSAKRQADKLISDVEASAKELGVDPDSIGKLSTLKKRIQLLDGVESYHSRLQKAI